MAAVRIQLFTRFAGNGLYYNYTPGTRICCKCPLDPSICDESVESPAELKKLKKSPNCLIDYCRWIGFTPDDMWLAEMIAECELDPDKLISASRFKVEVQVLKDRFLTP